MDKLLAELAKLREENKRLRDGIKKILRRAECTHILQEIKGSY